MKQFNKQKGAISLSEILVVVVIIGILAGVILMNYPAVKKQLALQRAAIKLSQDIRRAQEMAVAAEECPAVPPCGVDEIPAGGYGIHLSQESATKRLYYVLFADRGSPPNQECDFGSEQIGDDIDFESGIKIKDLLRADGSSTNHLNIIFAPPDPTTHLTDQNAVDLGNQISIEISLIDDVTKSKTITVNKAGLITVQ